MAKMHHVDPAIARRHHCPIGIDDTTMQCSNCPYRRVILVEIERPGEIHLLKEKLFSFNVKRIPVCFIDINAVTGEIAKVQAVEKN